MIEINPHLARLRLLAKIDSRQAFLVGVRIVRCVPIRATLIGINMPVLFSVIILLIRT
ncbi:hypothetical protein [Bradyrhizobium sp. DASA03120]|uniref:hypothetical protein n=1 Tax=Bradyrhizobium sp. SMVTL-02 TaxID=3395917 RepID=UPI003F727A9E